MAVLLTMVGGRGERTVSSCVWLEYCCVVTRDHACNHLEGNLNVHPHSRNEDLNHSSQFYGISNYKQSWNPTGSPMLSFQSLRRPLMPIDSRSSSAHSYNSTLKRRSAISLTTGQSSTAASDGHFRFHNVHLGRRILLTP